jgi:hypothetical protein
MALACFLQRGGGKIFEYGHREIGKNTDFHPERTREKGIGVDCAKTPPMGQL